MIIHLWDIWSSFQRVSINVCELEKNLKSPFVDNP